jgi:hypothetical protein
MFAALLKDEAGFIVSAELVLVATISVLSLVVGLCEIAHAANEELNDVSEAIGSLNQSFQFGGFRSKKCDCVDCFVAGSKFRDSVDDCDRNECDISCGPIVKEGPKGHNSF